MKKPDHIDDDLMGILGKVREYNTAAYGKIFERTDQARWQNRLDDLKGALKWIFGKASPPSPCDHQWRDMRRGIRDHMAAENIPLDILTRGERLYIFEGQDPLTPEEP